MPDITIPEAAVEAAARAMDANFNPDYYPILSAMFSDYAATALTAAAPYIAAQALRDAANELRRLDDGRTGGYYEAGRHIIRRLDARADEIEANNE